MFTSTSMLSHYSETIFVYHSFSAQNYLYQKSIENLFLAHLKEFRSKGSAQSKDCYHVVYYLKKKQIII